jgi:pilus assembly protein CpaD
VIGRPKKEFNMRSKLAILMLGTLVAGCATPGANPAARGMETVNVPVLTRETFVFDAGAPAGSLPPSEAARLDGWFQGLGLGYGDSICVDGAYADDVRSQVADIAGNYGLMVLPSAPVTAGALPPGTVRVIVTRSRAEVPNCPNWSVPSSPTTDNASTSHYGCALNSNLAAMVANPEDLFHGHGNGETTDAQTASKAVKYYRGAPLNTGLQNVSSKGK